MRITNLSCKNFRNFESLDLKFPLDRDINIICAPNGMGKSNLLEMLYYLSHIRPFRKVKDKELINNQKKYFYLDLEYKKNNLLYNLSISYNNTINNNIKKVFFNKKKITNLSSVLGEFLTVLFSNNDIDIISGAPSISRRFFDIFFSIIDKEYLHSLKNYQTILLKKNFALKNSRYHNLLHVYNEQIAKIIFNISQKRQKYITDIDKIFQEKFKLIGNFIHKTKLIYSHTSIFNNKDITVDNIFSLLEKNRKKDIEYGYSSIGPHRDKYLFLLNGNSFSKYASLGQTRLASLLLKSIQSEFYKKYFNINPILLLDDVILELDPDRKEAFLSEITKNNQMFITISDQKYLNFFKKEDINLIRIKDGRIQK